MSGISKVDTLKVQCNDFENLWEDIRHEVLERLDQELAKGWYILGENVTAFENELADYWGLPWAVGCGNGMDAIEISLRALGLKPGDEVLTTPLSAFATSLAIYRAGGIPVFVDVDELGNLDLELAEQVIRERGIKWMVPVHLFGIPLRLNRLKELKEEYQLKIVEDCAQAIGAGFDSKVVGSVGDLAAVSFYPTKNLGAIGDGGAILGKSKHLQATVASIRNYGQSEKYKHDVIGLNSRLDELQAIILRFLLAERLTEQTKRRIEIAQRYLNGIKNSRLSLPQVNGKMEPVWHLFPVLVEQDQDRFISYLRNQGICSGVHYPILIPNQLASEVMESVKASTLEKASYFSEHEVSLPIHPYLTEAQIDTVTTACNEYR